ncbi:MAG: hypothetical protein ACJ789_19275 [Thermomicrobiales bacterium]
MLVLVLLSGGIIFTLAALVDRPDESHGPAESAAVVSEHEATDPETPGTTGNTVEHGNTSEVTNSAESEHGEVGNDQPGLAQDDRQSDSVLSVDMESLNLVSPRLTLLLIGLTILLAAGLVTWWSMWMLVACVGLGLAGVANGVHEATGAGEELGILVPLPILASVLYGGAASLAGLAIIRARTKSVAPHSRGTRFAMSPLDLPTGHSEGAQDV